MHKPLSTSERAALQAEALDRAANGQSFANYPAIISGFTARGIPEGDIIPRVNVFTYNAWKAKGRQVRKGEHGVKILTFIVVADKDDETRTYRKPHTSVVFHVTQTDPVSDSARNREYVRDPGEDATDRWNETHGDRF